MSYSPVYTANRLELGQSLISSLRQHQEQLIRNVDESFRSDSAGLGRSSSYDLNSPVEDEVGNLTWIMHNCWRQYRYSMDEGLLRDFVYPLLRRSICLYMHLLEEGPDGRLHLPPTVSPEYGSFKQLKTPDAHYDLSLLRWGCETLLYAAKRMGIEDPLQARWADILARLTPLPVDHTGYKIGRDLSLEFGHRHFSHLLALFPLHITGNSEEERQLAIRSLRHWIAKEGDLRGFSFTGATSIAAAMGLGDEALAYLRSLMHLIKPNTMYKEAGPVIETPLAGAEAIHDMLLQSWGNIIRVKTETNRSNALLLEQMEMSIDSKLKGLEQLSLEIALNRNISSFSSVDPPLSDAHYYDLFQISESLRTYKNANDYIEQIYVMYTNSDTVISTYDHMNRQGLFQKLRQQDDTSFDQWNSLFERKYVNGYTPMTFWDGGTATPVVVFARSLVFNTPGQPPAIVLFVMKDSKLIESAPRHPDARMFILDTESRYIAARTDPGLLPQHLTYGELRDQQGIVYKDVQEQQAAVSYITSKITGWKYVSVLSASLFNEKMQYMRKLIWISIGMCFLVGGVICVLFLRKNYMPIQVMLQSLSHKFGLRFDGGSSEYSFLQGAIQHYFTEKEDMRARLDQHRNTIRAHLIRRLLKGSIEREALLHESLAAHHIEFSSDRFVVILMSVDGFGKFEQYGQNGLADQKEQMLHFILTNVLVREFMQEQMQVELTIAVGEVYSDIYGIAQSYHEALDALEYRIVLGSGQFIRYRDTQLNQAPPHHYYFPLSVEQQLIYVVKSGNYAKAEALIEDIFQKNFTGHPVSVPLAKCLMYNMASTMLNTVDEVSVTGKRSLEAHLLDVEPLLSCEHVPQMKMYSAT
ncbi:hypothetical protein BGX30_000656 [Mortierella sp. GBA39]|nr:hypothetical protein BGX30_000656 [Mortierella sp. GBA39]